MGKKTVLNNSYCQMINDGFGCPFMESKDAHFCANCLASLIQEIAKDLALLTGEADDDFLNGDDD